MTTRLYVCALAAGLALGQGAYAAEPAAAPRIEVKGLRDASKWFRVESQHFIVYSDSRRDEVVELLNSLERLDFLLRLYAKPFLVGQASAPKVSLYFHDRTGWLKELGAEMPKEAIGLYNSCTAGVQAFAFNVEPLTTAADAELPKARLNESLGYIFEGYARHFLYRNTDIRAPSAFIDGFAQYFSSVRFSDSQLVVGRIPLGIGGMLRLIDDGNTYELTFEDVLDGKDPARGATLASDLEAQARAWNLMHYMMASEENRAKQATFLEKVNEGMKPSKAFADVYGLSGSALSTAMWRYRTPGFKAVQVDVPELPQASMEFSQMTEATGDFVLVDATLKSCPDRKTGEAVLAKVKADAARVPNNDFAQLTLSRALVDWGNPKDALGWLDRFTRRDPKHVEALYLQGLANLKLAERAAPAERQALLAAAQRSLAQAAALKPGAPDVSYALFKTQIHASDEPDKTGVARAIVAWRQGHEVNTFARSAALAYAWMGDPVGAFRAFNVLATNERDPETADWARRWLDRLGAGVARNELLAEMRRESDSRPAFREWTVAHQDVMRDVQRSNGLSKAQGYLDTQSMGDPTKPQELLINRPSRTQR